ncbi:DNA-binding XRE family transcriptional regulator [Planifilum fimeticola]|uniref:DNA-binding XRE family transcriptional regulator n=2 Tax=Planifilum fimeticola TaxID=201975 RepID=A0A2T0LFP3_9BACL|nr:DNA-binding XRE family transcriptional regulator [Planifilum fimeticola]
MGLFAKRLKALRIKHHMLQKDMAKKLGITVSAYGFYEQGKREPTLEMVKKIAGIFDVTVDYLLGRTDDPKGNVTELSILDLERAIEMIEKGKAHFGGHELTEEDREFIAKMIRLAIERKYKRDDKDEQSATKEKA